ncbi:MAG: class I SAM-dependent methyltransferase [candidate division SR1 bacterium]|nr:class I SAM-dependent methyltransferase [candidate division SR1 bacterium]
MHRKQSFGTNKLSLLDRILYRLRIFQLQKHCDFNEKIIVDVGCGYNAIFLGYLQNKFMPKKLIAFDINLNVPFLYEKGISPFKSDLNQGFVLPEQPDMILCTAVLEHLDKPMIFLEYAYKNLKKGGCLVLTTPSIRSKPVLEFLAFRLKLISAVEIHDHKQYYTKEILVDYLQRAGFEKHNIHHHYFEFCMNNFVLVRK